MILFILIAIGIALYTIFSDGWLIDSIKNIEEINKSTYIDGYLLGGLSLKVEELKKFLKIIG